MKITDAFITPMPRNGPEPLKVGDQVQIISEWQDPGDEQYERFVIKAPDDCTQIRIQTVVPSLVFQPGEWIEADKLICLPLKTEHTNPQDLRRALHFNS